MSRSTRHRIQLDLRVPAVVAVIALLGITVAAIAHPGAHPQDGGAPATTGPAATEGSDSATQQADATEPPKEASAQAASGMSSDDSPSGQRPYLDLRRITPVTGDPAAGRRKAELCMHCHGETGVPVAPIFPNLSGQSIDYLYWELVEYQRGSRPQSPMTLLAADLSQQDMRDLAAFYASLPITRAETLDTEPVDAAILARGEQLYLHGDPARGIPACQGCHGNDARGHPKARHADGSGFTPYAVYPSLRSQPSDYLRAKLGEFRDGKLRESTTDFVMQEVGQRLDEDSVEALSSWLSRLD